MVARKTKIAQGTCARLKMRIVSESQNPSSRSQLISATRRNWELGFGIWDFHSVRVMRFVTLLRRPGRVDQLALRNDRVSEKSLRIDPLSRVVRAGVNATRCGKLRAKVASVRFVGGRFFLLDLDLGRYAFLIGLDIGLDLLDHFE